MLFFVTTSAFVADAFVVGPPSQTRSSKTELSIFGNALKDAFANDDKLGPRKNAGLKNGPKKNEQVTINGKSVNAVVGQKLKVVASSARVKIPYNCNQGDCGTCVVKMNGRKVKACSTNIPSGKVTIQTI